jgi:hypothetical protein
VSQYNVILPQKRKHRLSLTSIIQLLVFREMIALFLGTKGAPETNDTCEISILWAISRRSQYCRLHSTECWDDGLKRIWKETAIA